MTKIELSWNDHIFRVKVVEELYDKVYEVLPFSEPTSGKDFFKVIIDEESLHVGIKNIGNGLYMARVSNVIGNKDLTISGNRTKILNELMATIDQVLTPKDLTSPNNKILGNNVKMKIHVDGVSLGEHNVQITMHTPTKDPADSVITLPSGYKP